MIKIKNLVTEVSLALMITISILALLPAIFLLQDKRNGGKINSSFETQIKKANLMQDVASQEYLSYHIGYYLEDLDTRGLAEWADNYEVEYYIYAKFGRPIATSKNWTPSPEDTTVFHFEWKGAKEIYVVNAYQNPLGMEYSNILIPKLWTLFYKHNLLTLCVCLFFFVILLLSVWQFILHAGPMFKVCFFLFYMGIADIIFTTYVGIYAVKSQIMFCVLEKIILAALICIYIHYMKQLHQKVRKINDSESSDKKPVSCFPVSLRPFAMDIENATESISVAVNERMKSERLTTELICNVSHDLKTPLTSVINFSDLISKEKTENQTITEYANHLHTQSIRLKNLLDSLIEVSKASSGAIEIHMVPCRVQTVLEQCIVEYEDKLEANQITLIDLPCEENLMIAADTNALCRIFDNLLVNIAKYALPGSRAYLEVTKEKDLIVITFKNILKEACNLSAEELTERFVRGDASRHSEGHGLGLSIVKSLMGLMNGQLEVSSKYDVFEIKLLFPLVEFTEEDLLYLS